MNPKLLPYLCCPLCKKELLLEEEKIVSGKIIEGRFSCPVCNKQYPVIDSVPVFLENPSMVDVFDDVLDQKGEYKGILERRSIKDEWELYERNDIRRQEEYKSNKEFKLLVDEASKTDGLLLDIATGPGGSIISPILRKVPEMLLIASDKSKRVIRGQYQHFKQKGMLGNSSFLAFDVHLIPIKDNVVTTITSYFGVSNYREEFRVLKNGGRLLEIIVTYEPGSKTAKRALEIGIPSATLESYKKELNSVGFKILEIQERAQGKGKMEPEDGFPLENEKWFTFFVVATK